MKIRSRNIISGAMTVILTVAVFVSFIGINIGSHLCGMTGQSDVLLLADASPVAETECEFCTDAMPDMADCSMDDSSMDNPSMKAEDMQEEESCCNDESGSHKDMFGSITDESCCLETADFLINSFDINLPADYAGFSKITSNVQFELPLNIQLNGIFETERKHFKEIVYHPYCSDYLHFIQRMLT